jgi:hypothetical protein
LGVPILSSYLLDAQLFVRRTKVVKLSLIIKINQTIFFAIQTTLLCEIITNIFRKIASDMVAVKLSGFWHLQAAENLGRKKKRIRSINIPKTSVKNACSSIPFYLL